MNRLHFNYDPFRILPDNTSHQIGPATQYDLKEEGEKDITGRLFIAQKYNIISRPTIRYEHFGGL